MTPSELANELRPNLTAILGNMAQGSTLPLDGFAMQALAWRGFVEPCGGRGVLTELGRQVAAEVSND